MIASLFYFTAFFFFQYILRTAGNLVLWFIQAKLEIYRKEDYKLLNLGMRTQVFYRCSVTVEVHIVDFKIHSYIHSILNRQDVSAPMSPTSPSQNGDSHLIKSNSSKIETIKNWSISTYKCTKQLMFEKLGKTSRTVDTGIIILLFVTFS